MRTKVIIKMVIMATVIQLVLILCAKCYSQDWQLGDMPEKYKKLVKIKCIDTVSHGKYLYYYLPNSHWNIMYLDKNEEVVKCK